MAQVGNWMQTEESGIDDPFRLAMSVISTIVFDWHERAWRWALTADMQVAAWRRRSLQPRSPEKVTDKTDPSKRRIKNIPATVFLGCVFHPSSTRSPRKIPSQRARRKKKKRRLFTEGNPLDRSQQWRKCWACLIMAGKFVRLQGVWVCVCQIKSSWIPTLRGNKSDEVAVTPQAPTLVCLVLPLVGAGKVTSCSGWRCSSCDTVGVSSYVDDSTIFF